MDDIDIEALRRKVLAGDDDAICPLLLAQGNDPAVVRRIDAKLQRGRGRERDPAAYEKRVRAIIHYVKRGCLGISKPNRIDELIEQFFPHEPNVAKHLANGQGYPEEREEARRRLRAEADEAESNF